jgi:hypothetical protein
MTAAGGQEVLQARGHAVGRLPSPRKRYGRSRPPPSSLFGARSRASSWPVRFWWIQRASTEESEKREGKGGGLDLVLTDVYHC